MTKVPQLLKAMLFILLALFSSCAQEMIFDPDTQHDALAQKSSIIENMSNEQQNCNDALKELKSGESFGISCVIDLNGKNLILSENVTLIYEGGDIINGELIFRGGFIDGRFLNKSLKVAGNVKLKNSTFEFDPARWNIVQGHIDKRTAFSNRINLEKIIDNVKALEADTFKMGVFDAYFDVVTNTNTQNQNFYPWLESINIPSDFTLLMSPETHLRVFPNNYKKYALLSVYKEQNVNIVGGNLHGDRDEHDYSDGGTHEWGHLLVLKSAVDTKVDGLTMKNATGDGLKIESTGFTFQSYYTPSKNITITRCIFDSNRRNNLAVTDGYHIIIESNQFFRAGIDTPNSKGTNPRYAIDVEAYRKPDSSGKLINYEMVDDVIIRNNVQKASGRGGFIVSSGDNVIVENNYVENGIAFTETQHTKVRNNRIISNGENNLFGISAGNKMTKTDFNNEVHGNFIKGFDYGVQVHGTFQKIVENNIENCDIGIGGRNFAEAKIIGNNISSTNPHSRGIFVFYGSVNRVLFKDNIIDTPNNPFKFELVNLKKGQENYCAHLVNNRMSSDNVGLLLNTRGISLMKNTINTGLSVFDSKNFSIEHNLITAKKWDGIYLRKRNTAVKIKENSINVPSSKDCIRIQNTTDRKDIEDVGNDCI